MPHPAGAEDASATADHVVARHAGRLVDDDKTCVHRVIAVSTKSRSTDQRSPSVLNGRPDSVAPSIRMVDSKDPAEPESSTPKMMCASSKPSQRLVSGNQALYVASLAQNRIRSQCTPEGKAASSARSAGRLIASSTPSGKPSCGSASTPTERTAQSRPTNPPQYPAQCCEAPSTPSAQHG